jgi:cytochrome d ubiquinol oxidase subunit II
MHAIWFAILGLMLTAYAVLDGFDFGAGIVHLFVARTDDERRAVFDAIGPLWDGNEVWLIASGGVFVFAFPRAYAAAFSGLYLALMIVLWLLVLRGIAIEFRSKVDNPLWRAAWDATFALASTVMAAVLGVALGNVVRGVPLDGSGYFHEDLFAGMGAAHAGAIDPFTAVFGLFALAALGAHGATFLAWKTPGQASVRSRVGARWLWVATVVLGLLATAFTALAQPAFLQRVLGRAWLWPLPVCAIAAAIVAIRSLSAHRELAAFLASCTFIVSMLFATAGALYPTILRSTIDESFTLSAHNAASAPASLAIGLAIWLPAIALATAYFTYLFHSFKGKMSAADRHY